MLPRASLNLAWNTSGDRATTLFLGSPFFLISNLNLCLFILKSFPLVLPPISFVKKLVSLLLIRSLKVQLGCNEFFPETSTGWISLDSSNFLHRSDAWALFSSSWPSSGFAPTSPHFSSSSADSPRPGHSTSDEVSWKQNRGSESHPLPFWPAFWMKPRIQLSSQAARLHQTPQVFDLVEPH